MKKSYTKPQIVFESFVLSTNIAGNCEVKTWTPNSGTCAYPVTEGDFTWNIFLDSVTACTTTQAEGDYGVCYHTFENSSLFNS